MSRRVAVRTIVTALQPPGPLQSTGSDPFERTPKRAPHRDPGSSTESGGGVILYKTSPSRIIP